MILDSLQLGETSSQELVKVDNSLTFDDLSDASNTGWYALGDSVLSNESGALRITNNNYADSTVTRDDLVFYNGRVRVTIDQNTGFAQLHFRKLNDSNFLLVWINGTTFKLSRVINGGLTDIETLDVGGANGYTVEAVFVGNVLEARCWDASGVLVAHFNQRDTWTSNTWDKNGLGVNTSGLFSDFYGKQLIVSRCSLWQFWGDSQTAGQGVSLADSFVGRIVDNHKDLDALYINQGISGDKASDILARMPTDNYSVAGINSYTVIYAGHNDIANSATPAATKASIDSIVADQESRGANVHVCTYHYRPSGTWDTELESLNALLIGAYTVIPVAATINDADVQGDDLHLAVGGHASVASLLSAYV